MTTANVTKKRDLGNSTKLNVKTENLEKTLTLSNYQLTDGKLESRIRQFVAKYTENSREEVKVDLNESIKQT